MELGLGEIVFILVVALLVYGGRLPEVAAAVGRSLAELKRGLRDTTDSLRSDFDPLMDLDPRRAVRRAWQPPKLLEAQPGDVRAEVLARKLPATGTPQAPDTADATTDVGATDEAPETEPSAPTTTDTSEDAPRDPRT